MTLSHSNSALGAFYRRLCSRMDKPKANTATRISSRAWCISCSPAARPSSTRGSSDTKNCNASAASLHSNAEPPPLGIQIQPHQGGRAETAPAGFVSRETPHPTTSAPASHPPSLLQQARARSRWSASRPNPTAPATRSRTTCSAQATPSSVNPACEGGAGAKCYPSLTCRGRSTSSTCSASRRR